MSFLPAFTARLLSLGLSDALPTIVTRGQLVLLQFNVMKLLPAYSTIDGALRRGQLAPKGSVIESSSGSFAYGLARVCSALGHPLTIVSADLELWLHDALRALGARVELVDAGNDLSRVQHLRLERLQQVQREFGAYWPCQYHNRDNGRGYTAAAEALVRNSGVPDIVVCPVGSGGNSSGLIQILRTLAPRTRLVGIDCFGSITFGLPLGERDLGGIGNSLIPACVRHTAFDEVHWVNRTVAVAGARQIVADGLGDFGLTSGCAYAVARWLEKQHAGARIAVVFPDRAFRYVDLLATAPVTSLEELAPTTVQHPRDARAPWARVSWQRRRLTDWPARGCTATSSGRVGQRIRRRA